jgi:hypothetical protein
MKTAVLTKECTKSFLINVKIPEKTDSYSPVSHKNIIDFTMEQTDKCGLEVIGQRYTQAKEGRQANGFFHLKGIGDAEMGLELAWQNSYDKSIGLKWAIGGKVFICSNGMFQGDIGMFQRKHTGDALNEYSEAVRMYVSQAGDIFQKMVNEKERMKEIEITKRTSAELIGRMFLEEDIITSTQLNIIKREMEAPSFDYKIKDTVWNLYNNCTVALKEAHPQFHLTQHMDLHKFIKKEYAF